MINSTIISLESNITNIKDIEDTLTQYSTFYSTLERKLFNQIKDKRNVKLQYNKLQKSYIKKYQIHARLFKTLWKQVIGKISSLKSNSKNYKTDRINKIKDLKNKLKYVKDKFKCFQIKKKINRLKQLNKIRYKPQAVWGSKAFFKKQWNIEDHNLWLNEWKIKRNNNIFIIGSSDESFGNSLCQLQTLYDLRLTLPKTFKDKHLNLSVNFDKDKKIYQYLKQAIVNKTALTFRIFQNSKNKKWYVQVCFKLDNECRNFNNGTIGVDINYNLISTCSIKKDGNKKDFINYNFDVNEQNKDKNTQILSNIVNQIVEKAVQEKKTITIEKLNLKNVVKYKKVSLVCYNKFINLLKSRCVKFGMFLLEINPAFTSVIGKLKYSKKLGRSKHEAASYVIGRRGLNYIERIPLKYISLLYSKEKEKSLLTKWNLINKRLQNVSQNEKPLGLIPKDHTNCNFNLAIFRLL